MSQAKTPRVPTVTELHTLVRQRYDEIPDYLADVYDGPVFFLLDLADDDFGCPIILSELGPYLGEHPGDTLPEIKLPLDSAEWIEALPDTQRTRMYMALRYGFKAELKEARQRYRTAEARRD
jgi:hypothetical protein